MKSNLGVIRRMFLLDVILFYMCGQWFKGDVGGLSMCYKLIQVSQVLFY